MKEKTLKTFVLGIGIMVIGLTQFQSDAIAQSGGGKTTSVVVTNTGSNPVPVRVIPNRTVELLSVNRVEIQAGGKREWQVDVRGYSRIKVCSLGSYWFSVLITDLPNPTISDIASFDGVVLGVASIYGQTQDDACRVIEFLPESDIYVTAFNQANEPARGNVRVWAQ